MIQWDVLVLSNPGPCPGYTLWYLLNISFKIPNWVGLTLALFLQLTSKWKWLNKIICMLFFVIILTFIMIFGSIYNGIYKAFICIIIFDSYHKPVIQIVHSNHLAFDKKMRERKKESESNVSQLLSLRDLTPSSRIILI